MTKIIGVPRGMLYYEYYPMWEEYFRNLNLNVISSPKTNKDILNAGILSCVDEACLPVKIFHGHVDYLKDKVDYLFVPKIISLYKKEYCCPKHLGLSDMVKHSIKNLPPIIEPQIHLGKINSLRNAVIDTGHIFTKNYFLIAKAYKRAIESQSKVNQWLSSSIIPEHHKDYDNDSSTKLLVLGHSYNVYDELINMGILQKLVENNVQMVFAEDVSEENTRYYSSQISKRMFWTHGRRIVGSSYYLIENKYIDGVIYLTAFGCGLDSVLVHLVEKKAVESNIPIMIMTLDEQTGEAGFVTRFEAFLDMMKWRSRNENHFSSFR